MSVSISYYNTNKIINIDVKNFFPTEAELN
jgi:hypothetical protein